MCLYFRGTDGGKVPLSTPAPHHISWRWHQPNPRSNIESQHQPATPTDEFFLSISRDPLSAQAEKRVCTPGILTSDRMDGCNMTWRLGGTMPTGRTCAALHALGHDRGLRNRAEPRAICLPGSGAGTPAGRDRSVFCRTPYLKVHCRRSSIPGFSTHFAFF